MLILAYVPGFYSEHKIAAINALTYAGTPTYFLPALVIMLFLSRIC